MTDMVDDTLQPIAKMARNKVFDVESALKDIKNKVFSIANNEPVNNKELSKSVKELALYHYDLLHDQMRSILKEIFSIIYQKICESHDPIQQYVNHWPEYKQLVKTLDDIFMPLNEKITQRDTVVAGCSSGIVAYKMMESDTIYHMMMTWWKDIINKYSHDLRQNVFITLDRTRMDFKVPDLGPTKHIIDSFYRVESHYLRTEKMLYNSAIKGPLVERAKEYYTFKGEKMEKDLLSLSTVEYVEKCIDIFKFECELSKLNFYETEDILQTVWNCLFENKTGLLPINFRKYLQGREIEGLKDVRWILKFASEDETSLEDEYRSCLAEVFRRHSLVTDTSKLWEIFMTDYGMERQILKDVFQSSSKYHSIFDKVICEHLNKEYENGTSVVRYPELLVNSCDQFLRKTTKGMSASDFEAKLDGIITIVNYIDDKDVFSKLYSKSLAKRLIHSASESQEAEEKFIEKLKMSFGGGYVQKFESMITDVGLSAKLTSEYKNIISHSYSFNFFIMRTGSWPVQLNKSSFLAPKELEQGMQSFGEFYTNVHKGRKLHFNHGLSSCEITLNYLKKKITVQTSIFVMSILVVFNDTESAKFFDIKTTTGIAHEDLKKYLQYLRAQNILLNEDGDNITDESEFNLNFKYENAKRLIKLKPVMRDQAQETKEVVKSVAEDRKMFLQALIVRIMKGKKTMNHKDLANEVVQESIKMFVPSQTLITSVINYLIQKEYMEKSRNSDCYNYLA